MESLLLLTGLRTRSLLPLRLRNLKLAAPPRRHMVHIHPVDLLECTALAFNNAKVDDEGSDEQTSCEDIAVGEVDGAGDEGGEEAEQEVPEPVGGGGEGHALGAVLGGEELGDDGPDHGAPGHCECTITELDDGLEQQKEGGGG